MKYIIYILTIFLFSGCIKNWKDCDKGKTSLGLSFILPIEISPAKDTFNIGDTITIEHVFNENLVNQSNGKTYSVVDHDFKTTMAITDLNTPSPSKSYKNPTLITLEGESTGNYITSSDYQAIYVNYHHENGQFKYKVLFIVDKPGFYLINFFSQRLEKTSNITECPEEFLAPYYTTNNNGDNNYEMIKNAISDYYYSYDVERYNKEGAYCFYVK